MVHVGGVSGKPDATQGWGGSRGLRAVQCDANPVRASVDLTFTARRSVVVDSWCVCDRPDVYEECRCHERSRILFTCRPFSGHFDPLLPLAAGGSLISRADEQMRPRSQRCGQINDRFTGAPALLREENPSPSAPSIDHVRNVNGAAHVTNLSTCPRLARTFNRATSPSSPLTATAVWALCGSIPMSTCISASKVSRWMRPWWALLLRIAFALDHLSRATPRRGPDRMLFVLKPNPHRWPAGATRATRRAQAIAAARDAGIGKPPT